MAKQPQQTFDMLPMMRVRVRGTQEQIAKVHAWLFQQTQARVGRFTVAQSVSGAFGSDPNCKQWGSNFNVAVDLVGDVRVLLLSLGIKEEE